MKYKIGDRIRLKVISRHGLSPGTIAKYGDVYEVLDNGFAGNITVRDIIGDKRTWRLTKRFYEIYPANVYELPEELFII